ncbi:hypothetical protein FQR65_LT02111 [Abscondita terminalis]|nr:hypothetical protein FQR65_LT02111 [Abscondita terminalis]
MHQEHQNKQKNAWETFPSIQNTLKHLKLSENKNEINILLLGETGVGKSTFINAFFNYVSFSTFWKAKNEKLQVMIPSQFTITDENYEERLINVGEDHNESIEIGASATQSCRSYIYLVPHTNVTLRLIDTPGIGDPRGIDRDNVNMENVLSFIGELEHLNAICILLKPNNSRMTVLFEFCIKQLLSRLEKSASKNLIFVFTNTRSTFYRPGETLPTLKRLLSTIKGVDICCEKKNMFCTDNESFRFLAALKNKVKFRKDDITNFGKSWAQSNEECLRMIAYIVGDGNNPGLIPHEVKNTISVNEARRLIVQLTKPLAEIAQLIQDNIRAVDTHKMSLKLTNTTLTELKSKLYIPIVDLKVTTLKQPTTVCTSLKCSTVYQVGDKKKWHYHQRCHDPCYLRNVPREVIGSPELVNCAAMNQSGACKKCTCRYQVHMHIYYETETFESRLEDKTVKTTINSKEQAWQNARILTSNLSSRLVMLNNERQTIIKTTAKFACFLKNNAIAPYNDAYEAYIKYLIDREKSLGEVSDSEMIKQLERLLREYGEEKTIIMNAISEAKDRSSVIKADEIIHDVRCLYSLNLYGSKIQELFHAQDRARKDENNSQTKEFVYTATFNTDESSSKRIHRRVKTKQRNLQFSSNTIQNRPQNSTPALSTHNHHFFPFNFSHGPHEPVLMVNPHSSRWNGSFVPFNSSNNHLPFSSQLNRMGPPPPYDNVNGSHFSHGPQGSVEMPHSSSSNRRIQLDFSRGQVKPNSTLVSASSEHNPKPNTNEHNLHVTSSSDSETEYFSSNENHND